MKRITCLFTVLMLMATSLAACTKENKIDDTIDVYEFDSLPDYLSDYEEGPVYLIAFDEEVTNLAYGS